MHNKEVLVFTLKSKHINGTVGFFDYLGDAGVHFKQLMKGPGFDDIRGLNSENIHPTKLKNVIEQTLSFITIYPEYLDAYAILSLAFDTKKDHKEAVKCLEKIILIAKKKMPKDFDGMLMLDDGVNYKFLNLHAEYIRQLIEVNDVSIAQERSNQHSQWVGYTLHTISQLFATAETAIGNHERARLIMGDVDCFNTPAQYLYNHAVINFRESKYDLSLCYLRRAFLLNPYIAEQILGNKVNFHKQGLFWNSQELIDESNLYVNSKVGFCWLHEDGLFKFLAWAMETECAICDKLEWAKAIRNFNDLSAVHGECEKIGIIERFIASITPESSRVYTINQNWHALKAM